MRLTATHGVCDAWGMMRLGNGWEAGDCLQMWSQVQHGTFSQSGSTFTPGPSAPEYLISSRLYP